MVDSPMVYRYILILFALAVTARIPAHATAANAIDSLVVGALNTKIFTSAAVAVGSRSQVLFQSTYGRLGGVGTSRTQLSTRYDLASLTKVLATAPSVMKLVEMGQLQLTDTLAQYYPSVEGLPIGGVTLEQLLLHQGGLAAGVVPESDYSQLINKILEKPLNSMPGTKTLYSDLGFILLGDIVSKVSGLPLGEFASLYLWSPLGMSSTGFGYPSGTDGSVALAYPDGRAMIHDPTARSVSDQSSTGHAGAFSTVSDLVKWVQYFISRDEAESEGMPLLPAIRNLMTTLLPGRVRGLGWDFLGEYSHVRGTVFTPGVSFGHTGFTGTMVWMDPVLDRWVIILSNRTYYGDRNAIRINHEFRAKLADLAAQYKLP